MEVIEKSGKSVKEAVNSALMELGVTEEETVVEIIEEPAKGFLGFFKGKPAKVRVAVKDSLIRKVKLFLNSIFQAMDLLIEMNISEKDNRVYVDLKGPEVGLLIGRRGETMEALQFLVNLQVNKNNSTRKKVFIDIEGYRGRREETLQRLALKLANKAKQKGKAVVLEPMSAQERRIIHTALQVRSDIYTFSEGEEPYRKVVISPRNRRSSI